MAKPTCGGRQTVAPAPTLWATVLLFIGLGMTIGQIVTAVIGFTKVAEAVGGGVASVISALGGVTITAGAAFAYVAIIAAAVITAVLIMVWAWQSYSALCGSPPFGRFACVTGVIDAVTAGFDQWYSELVGFAGNQPQIDVVVKSAYWPIVTMDNPQFLWCAGCANCPPSVAGPAGLAGGNPPCSPELPCYYHNRKVCSAALGSSIGATVGAAVGAAIGIIGGIAAMAAVGCLAAAVFAWICWIVLLIVVLVVIIVVVVVALVGSIIGTQAGKAVAGGSAGPAAAAGVALVPGTYVSVVGNMVQASQSLGSNALWFAGWIPNANGTAVDDVSTTNGNGTTVLGMSTGTVPFCFTDPDAAIPDAMDSCFLPP